jgi:hypothetical protein
MFDMERKVQHGVLLRESLIWAAFIGCFLVFAAGTVDVHERYQIDEAFRQVYEETPFPGEPAKLVPGADHSFIEPINFSGIKGLDQAWAWVNFVLYPKVILAQHQNKQRFGTAHGHFMRGNKNLWGIRFRVVRASTAKQANKTGLSVCARHSKMARLTYLIPECYDYGGNPGVQAFGCTDTVYPGINNRTTACNYTYTSAKEIDDTVNEDLRGGSLNDRLNGKVASYDGGGYFVDVPSDAIKAKAALRSMQGLDGSYPITDDYTRALIITFVSFNGNNLFLTRTTAIFERNSAGHLYKRIDFDSADFIEAKAASSSMKSKVTMLTGLVLAAWSLAYNLGMLLHLGKLRMKFFEDAWNLIDSFSHFLFLFHVYHVRSFIVITIVVVLPGPHEPCAKNYLFGKLSIGRMTA